MYHSFLHIGVLIFHIKRAMRCFYIRIKYQHHVYILQYFFSIHAARSEHTSVATCIRYTCISKVKRGRYFFPVARACISTRKLITQREVMIFFIHGVSLSFFVFLSFQSR